MRIHSISLVFICFLGVIYNSYLFATIMPELTVAEMTKKSTIILTGKVESITSRWNDDRTTIHTLVRIVPTSTLKGKCEEKFVIVELLGGTLSNLKTIAVGEAKFKASEEVLVFLEKNPKWQSPFYRVVGLSQGKFNITKSPNSNRAVVERDLTGITFINKTQIPFPKYLDELIQQIKSAAH